MKCKPAVWKFLRISGVLGLFIFSITYYLLNIGYAACNSCCSYSVKPYIFSSTGSLVMEITSASPTTACCSSPYGTENCNIESDTQNPYTYYLCSNGTNVSSSSPCPMECGGFLHSDQATNPSCQDGPYNATPNKCVSS